MSRSNSLLSLRTASLWLAVLFLLGAGIGCEDEGTPVEQGFPTLNSLYAADYLSSYTEVVSCRLSSPHPIAMRVHIFPESVAAMYLDRDARGDGFPAGTIIVKTEYPDAECQGTPARITAMLKGAAGSAPSSGDWTWQEFDFRSTVEREGALSSCIACHNGGNSDCGPEWDYTCVILD